MLHYHNYFPVLEALPAGFPKQDPIEIMFSSIRRLVEELSK